MSNNADYIEEKIEMKTITPFKMFTLTKFPFIEETFDALNNYQLLCKIVEYLNKVIESENNQNENINQLYSAFLALQLHVNTFFDTLDVQDEINNKLDEMAENGLLESIIAKYINNSMLRIFENVESFKNANLVAGMKIKTLGYYEINDGGASMYLIRNRLENDIEDNGSIHFINNLVAELVIENNSISVKQFGAKGDGLNDDTNFLNNATNFIKNKSINDVFNKNFILNFNSGKYLINDTIKVSVLCKIKPIGNVVILSTMKDKPAIHVTSDGVNKINGSVYLKSQSFIDGSFMGCDSGVFVIQRNNDISDINDLSATSIGLLIGDNTTIDNTLNVSRCHFDNIVIMGFSEGIHINSINTYILTFHHCRSEYNRKSVIYNAEVWKNSGENISFENCTFSHSYNAFVIKKSGLCGVNFKNCSFDFNGNVFLHDIDGNSIINCVGCHFEGIQFNEKAVDSTIENTVGYGYLIFRSNNNQYSKPLYCLTNCYLHLNTNYIGPHLFGAVEAGKNKNLKVVIDNFMISYSKSRLNFGNRFLADENIELKSSAPTIYTSFLPYDFSSLDKEGKFNNIDNSLTGNVLVESEKEALNNYNYTLLGNDWSTLPLKYSFETEDKIFDKSMIIEGEAKTTFLGISRKITNLKSRYLSSTCYFKLNDIILMDNNINDISNCIPTIDNKIKFYDNNNNLLESFTNISSENQYKNDNGWISLSVLAKVPINASYCVISNNMTLKNNNTSLNFKGSIKCGGIIINELD